MRIIVWGINYAPEITGIAPHNVAFCEFLREQGVDVEMVTTFAYYPAWRKSAEDRRLLFRTDVINSVRVHRCWHFVPERVSAWKRIIHEATFIVTSTIRVLSLKRADVYLIASPPLLLGMAAAFVTALKRAAFVFHVQDLQPDAAVGLNMLRPGWFTRALYWLEAFAYKHATRVSGISEEILDAFRRKGVPDEKLILFPNGVAIPTDSQIPAAGAFRPKHGFSADEFLAVYAGNLGVKQGLDILLDAADRLRSEAKIRIVLCGDGAERASLAQEIADRSLTNMSMLPLKFGLDYQELLVDADVSLITQQSGSGNAFFPSKLLVTLAYGSPVITVADEESALARAVANGRFGINLLPGQVDELARTFRELAQDRQRLSQWSANGRDYVKRFEQRKLLADFFERLESLV
ncbi:MAG: WcaI family glycosyltransferase [Verrucomicrobiota bacterium]|nr:WcaI family glycosyltransferase [Verrucomicrobiota bacterium]